MAHIDIYSFHVSVTKVISPKIELPTFGRALRHSDTSPSAEGRRGILGDRYNQV
jgi:hypothetical protein